MAFINRVAWEGMYQFANVVTCVQTQILKLILGSDCCPKTWTVSVLRPVKYT